MRSVTVAALGVASIFALGCSDSSVPTSTDPGFDARYGKPTSGTCDGAVSRDVKSQLQNMFAGSTLKTAQSKWDAVESACPAGPDSANASLMTYVDYLLSQYPANFITPKTESPAFWLLLNINTSFTYVGYAAPNIPASTLSKGIVAVIPATGGVRKYVREHLGGFSLPEQTGTGADKRGHLFTMDSIGTVAGGCLSVDNLKEYDQCVDVSAYPAVSPNFSPGITVGLCAKPFTGGALSLGHEKAPNSTEIAGSLDFPTLAECHPPEGASSWMASPSQFFKRLASTGKQLFGVSKVYATDKGLGGIGGTLSPFGVVDAQIFAASFSVPPNTVGSSPLLTNGNFVFTSSVTPPGSILVQSSLGTYTGPLVVLSQGGGACENCGSLNLTGKFYSVSGSAADDGVYEIAWTSVQASPSVKGAPFVVRTALDSVVASVSYATVSSVNQLLFDGTVVGSWVRNVAQTFVLTVDLDNNTAKLSIDGVAVGTTHNISANATLATFGAEFTGIDSGVMGWDEIGVKRIK